MAVTAPLDSHHSTAQIPSSGLLVADPASCTGASDGQTQAPHLGTVVLFSDPWSCVCRMLTVLFRAAMCPSKQLHTQVHTAVTGGHVTHGLWTKRPRTLGP